MPSSASIERLFRSGGQILRYFAHIFNGLSSKIGSMTQSFESCKDKIKVCVGVNKKKENKKKRRQKFVFFFFCSMAFEQHFLELDFIWP